MSSLAALERQSTNMLMHCPGDTDALRVDGRFSGLMQKTLLATGASILLAPLLGACSSGSANTNPSSRPATRASGATISPTVTSGPPGVIGRAGQEIAEFSAPIFDTLSVGASIISHTVVKNPYRVICRIPPNNGQPKTVQNGGWYKLRLPNRKNTEIKFGWAAANTFFNDGPQSFYDPNIPKCSLDQINATS